MQKYWSNPDRMYYNQIPISLLLADQELWPFPRKLLTLPRGGLKLKPTTNLCETPAQVYIILVRQTAWWIRCPILNVRKIDQPLGLVRYPQKVSTILQVWLTRHNFYSRT